jgi:hypothetical protein
MRMKPNSLLTQRMTSSAEPAEVNGEEGCGGGELDHEIAVADAVHGVLGDARAAGGIDESEARGDELAVEGKRAAGERAGAERADIHALAGIGRGGRRSRSSIST